MALHSVTLVFDEEEWKTLEYLMNDYSKGHYNSPADFINSKMVRSLEEQGIFEDLPEGYCDDDITFGHLNDNLESHYKHPEGSKLTYALITVPIEFPSERSDDNG